MRFLIGVFSIIAASLLATPWLLAGIEDSGFKHDVAFAPTMVTGREGVKANAIAEEVRKRAIERGIVLPPDGLTVEVSATREGKLRVVGGTMSVVGPNSSPIQDVTINASYDRPVLGFFRKHVDVIVNTAAPGTGTASSYPARALEPTPNASQ